MFDKAHGPRGGPDVNVVEALTEYANNSLENTEEGVAYQAKMYVKCGKSFN